MKLPAILGMFAVVVYLGNLQKGDKIPGNAILGAVILFVFLAGLDAVNSSLATGFAILLLLAAVLRYGPDLLKGIGLDGR